MKNPNCRVCLIKWLRLLNATQQKGWYVMLQLRIVVGTIDGNTVSIRRSADGSLIVHVTDGHCEADYQRVQQGLLAMSSTYPSTRSDTLYNSLMQNLKEIDRRSLEMSEAEMRIAYRTILKADGYTVQIGQSNSLQVFISVEKNGMRALLQYSPKAVTFISTSFDKEENTRVRTLVANNMLQIVTAMRKYNMLPSTTKSKAQRLYETDENNFETGMTEVGLRERAKVDRQVSSVFRTLESAGFSNLEIQAMLMESVLEIAMQSRLTAKQNHGNDTNSGRFTPSTPRTA